MPLPIVAGIITLCVYASNAIRGARYAQALLHAIRVSAQFSSNSFGLASASGRVVSFSHSGARYTLKLLKSGELTVMGSNGAPVSARLLSELGPVLARAQNFGPLYAAQAGRAVVKPSLEMIMKIGL